MAIYGVYIYIWLYIAVDVINIDQQPDQAGATGPGQQFAGTRRRPCRPRSQVCKASMVGQGWELKMRKHLHL